MTLALRQGGVYVDREGGEWVCWRVRPGQPDRSRADCIRVSDGRNDYFYLDGRYDMRGERELCLVREARPSLLPRSAEG